MRRPGEGEGTLHLYHRSIWLSAGCDLELGSSEMASSSKKEGGGRREGCDVAAVVVAFCSRVKMGRLRERAGCLGWLR